MLPTVGGVGFIGGEPIGRTRYQACLASIHGYAGAGLSYGPSIAAGAAAVIFHAMRIPTNKITKPISPCMGSCKARKGDTNPTKIICMSAAPRFIFGLVGFCCGDCAAGCASVDSGADVV